MSSNQSPNVKHRREDSAIAVKVVSAAGAAPAADLDLGSVTARGVIIVTAGNLVMDDLGGRKSTVPLPAGQFAICITKIYDTSTVEGVTLLF
jgi:hypothetical protein